MRSAFLLLASVLAFFRFSAQSCDLICNGGFDSFITTGVALVSTVPCWSTTASDGKIEVWGSGFSGVNSAGGSQHVELNATQAASMYQDFPVISGSTYTICFSHRGRAGIDTIGVSAGPSPNGPFISLGRFGDGTTSWGVHCVTFTASTTGTYRLMFTPLYWSGGNSAIGNFLDQVSVTGPASFSVSVSSPTICPGMSTTLSVAGASTYSWSTSSTASAIVVSPAVTTSYTLVASAGTCTSVSVHTVVVAPATMAVSSATICAGEQATLTASGLQVYTWNPGNLNGNPVTVSPQNTTLYQVNGSSASGCTAVAQATVFVNPVPVVTVTSSGTSCSSFGQATVFAGGGSGSYSYMWMPGAATGSVAGNLAPGTYSVSVTDNITGCGYATLTTVAPFLPTVTAAGGTVCTGQTLSLTATSQAGAAYAWTGPNNFFSTQQNPHISNAPVSATGFYTVTITTVNGCTNSATVHAAVQAPPLVTASLSASYFCAMAYNGSPSSISLLPGGANFYTLAVPSGISVSGGNPAFSLSAIPPFPAQSTAFTSTLYGTAAGLCTSSVMVSFSVNPNPVVTVSSSTNIVCAGETFTYQSAGAQNYTWTAVSPNTSFLASNSVGVSKPGNSASFAVYGSSLGCNSDLASGSISVVPMQTINILPVNATLCPGGSVALSVLGNAQHYSWFPFTALDAFSGQQVTAAPLEDITYTVTGATHHCRSSATVTVSVLSAPVPSAAFLDAKVCLHEHATFTGEGAVQYQWLVPGGQVLYGKNVTFQVASLTHAGIYTLVATGGNGCKATATAMLEVDQLPHGNLGGREKVCAPFCSDYSFYGNGAAVTSTWTGNGKSWSDGTFEMCFVSPGIYVVTGTLLDTVTGCRNAATYSVRAFPPPKADFSWDSLSAVEGQDVQFFNTSVGEGQAQWKWHFENDKGFRPEGEQVSYTYEEPGRYTMAMIVYNDAGCSDTVVKYVDIGVEFAFYVPNAFTPNVDGRNDVFQPVGRGLRNYSMMIFDRWGELIFHTTELQFGWNGEYRGQPCKQDIYNWIISFTSSEGEGRKLSGRVMLIR